MVSSTRESLINFWPNYTGAVDLDPEIYKYIEDHPDILSVLVAHSHGQIHVLANIEVRGKNVGCPDCLSDDLTQRTVGLAHSHETDSATLSSLKPYYGWKWAAHQSLSNIVLLLVLKIIEGNVLDRSRESESFPVATYDLHTSSITSSWGFQIRGCQSCSRSELADIDGVLSPNSSPRTSAKDILCRGPFPLVDRTFVRKEGGFYLSGVGSSQLHFVEGYGMERNIFESFSVALYEFIERSAVCRLYPPEGRVVDHTHGKLTPSDLGIYSGRTYERFAESLEFPDNPDYRYDCIRGRSLFTGDPVDVPVPNVYYGLDGRVHVLETTSGVACGASREQAVVGGLCELLERDAIVNWWRHKVPMPRITPTSIDIFEAGEFIRELESRYPINIRLSDARLMESIPIIFATAVSMEPDFPYFNIGASCKTNSHEAALKALKELSHMLHFSLEYMRDNRDHIRELVKSPELVSEISDHSARFFVPDQREEIDFFYSSSAPQINIDDISPEFQEPMLIDGMLERVIDSVRPTLRELIEVDITSTIASAADLNVIRIVSPDLHPITFGYGMERLIYSPRDLYVQKFISPRPVISLESSVEDEILPHPFA